jgi:hypothetical protein
VADYGTYNTWSPVPRISPSAARWLVRASTHQSLTNYPCGNMRPPYLLAMPAVVRHRFRNGQVRALIVHFGLLGRALQERAAGDGARGQGGARASPCAIQGVRLEPQRDRLIQPRMCLTSGAGACWTELSLRSMSSCSQTCMYDSSGYTGLRDRHAPVCRKVLVPLHAQNVLTTLGAGKAL